ncbi:MAG: UDP-glucose 4-epimerase GalE [Bacteriovoracia bacterium]
MQNILVIGGAGYIGSHAAKCLKQKGYNPIVLDDLSTGHRRSVLFGDFVEASYCDKDAVASTLKKYQIQTVMHFGAKALVGESIENPLYYYRENVGGANSLLEAMKEAQVNRIIFSSTCATFGEPSGVPIHERLPQNPVNPYGQTKLVVEKMLADADRAHGIKYVILRYFNAAGADPEGQLGEDHQPETHLIPRVLQSCLGIEKQFKVFGNDYATPDGSCVRDYVHVNDLAAAHLKAIEYLNQNNTSNDFNLGTENGYSVFQIVDEVEKVTGKKVPYTLAPRRIGDPAVLVADARKAKETLSWTPNYSLQEIISTAYQWHRKAIQTKSESPQLHL